MIPDVGYSVLIWKKKINGLKQPIFHLSLLFCPIQLIVTETEENLEFKMNLILLSNKWIDQKVRRGLAKIEKKAFGKKFFCRCRNGRNGRMAPCPKKKNESQSTKDGDETLLCTSRHTLIVTHPPTCLHTRSSTYSFTHRHSHMHTHAHAHTCTHPQTH